MDDPDDNQLAELRSSAREWHRLQLGALAFVGLCGALQRDAGTADPRWLQTTAGLLALAGLGVAGLAVLTVATVAWPLTATVDTRAAAVSAGRRLRSGIALTFVSVVLTALAASSNWWPSTAAADSVTVTTSSGSACGRVVPGTDGWLTLDVDGQQVRTPLAEVVRLAPSSGC